MRRIVFLSLTFVSWSLLFAWAADITWREPVMPIQRKVFHGVEFQSIVGAGIVDENRLQVNAVGADHSTLQSVKMPAFNAKEFPLLRYHFEHFPRTLELSLVFRLAEEPEDVKVISLPVPGPGEFTFSLSLVPEWHGTITELGFAEYPTPQLVPPDLGFQPFTLVKAELWSPSWSGAVAALFSDWFAYWPWALLSVSAVGIERDILRAHSMVLVLALGVGFSALWGVVLLKWRIRIFAAAIAALWIALDLNWMLTLYERNYETRKIYAGKPWAERVRLIPDSDILRASEQVKQVLSEFPHARILLASDSSYSYARFYYHLLPVNVAGLDEAFASLHQKTLPLEAIIVLYQADEWVYSPAQGTLSRKNTLLSFPVQALLESGDLHVYRVLRDSQQ